MAVELQQTLQSPLKTTMNELALILMSEDIDRLFAETEPHHQTDAFTGLAARRHFIDLPEALLSEPPPEFPRPELILDDIDRFKDINDSSSPLVCDSVLRSVAQRLRSIETAEQMDIARRAACAEIRDYSVS